MPTVTREDSDDDTVLFKVTDRISPSETQNVADLNFLCQKLRPSPGQYINLSSHLDVSIR